MAETLRTRSCSNYLRIMFVTRSRVPAKGIQDVESAVICGKLLLHCRSGVNGDVLGRYERLKRVQSLYERVKADGVAGDLVECGVWRGGITVRATLGAWCRRFPPVRHVWFAFVLAPGRRDLPIACSRQKSHRVLLYL